MQVFISHSSRDDAFVDQLLIDLAAHHIDAFVDHQQIQLSDRWDEKVDEALKRCNHMIAVISPDSIESVNCRDEWHCFLTRRKEIIPVWIRGSEMYFRLERTQYVDVRDPSQYQHGIRRLLDYLCDSIASIPEPPSRTTIQEGERRTELYARYPLRVCPDKAIGIATGNIAELKNVDVLVNSENDYLCMDSMWRNTVSASLNAFGALRDEQGEIIELTIAKALETARKGLPARLPPATVLVTQSGSLRNNGVRHILHAVSVKTRQRGGLDEITDVELGLCVVKALREIDHLNRTVYHPEQPEPPLRTIAFPLLTTGEGGRAITPTAKILIERAIEHFLLYPDTLIDSVYFTAYRKDQLDDLQAAFNAVRDLNTPVHLTSAP